MGNKWEKVMVNYEGYMVSSNLGLGRASLMLGTCRTWVTFFCYIEGDTCRTFVSFGCRDF